MSDHADNPSATRANAELSVVRRTVRRTMAAHTARHPRTCAVCSAEFPAKRADTRYCGGNCQRKAHRARRGRNRQSEMHERTCTVCGAIWRTRRADAKFCSDTCKGARYATAMKKRCLLPSDHPVIVLIAAQRLRSQPCRACDEVFVTHRPDQLYCSGRCARRAQDQRKRARRPEWRTARECPGCACTFSPLHTPQMVTCSPRCARRLERRRRRLSDNRLGWVWSDFMRIAAKFDWCCAYCGSKPERLDPDHVIPLARGGPDSATNLLPACRSCNSSKGARLLDEWAAWRTQRGMEPRTTTWAVDDVRFTHLTHVVLAA